MFCHRHAGNHSHHPEKSPEIDPHTASHHPGSIPEKQQENAGGTYYCPMHCEGDRTYDKPGHCPVCGMDLVQQPALKTATKYTCPMHPEIIQLGRATWRERVCKYV